MKRVTQGQVAKAAGTDQSVVSKVLTGYPSNTCSRALQERVLRAARKLGYDFGRVIRRRRAERRHVNVAVRIEIIGARGETLSRGQAQLRNLSLVGAFISDLKLSPRRIPLDIFHVRMQWTALRGRALSLVGVPVRLDRTSGGLGLGIAFEAVDPGQLALLKRVLRGR